MLFASTTTKEFSHANSKIFQSGRQYAKGLDQHLDADPTVAFFNIESWATRNDVLVDHSS